MKILRSPLFLHIFVPLLFLYILVDANVDKHEDYMKRKPQGSEKERDRVSTSDLISSDEEEAASKKKNEGKSEESIKRESIVELEENIYKNSNKKSINSKNQKGRIETLNVEDHGDSKKDLLDNIQRKHKEHMLDSDYEDDPHTDNEREYEHTTSMKPDADDYRYNSAEIHDDDEDESDLSVIWSKHMQNFEPSTLLTFEIASNSEEFLFEDIQEINTYVRGVFYSNNENEETIIQFFITDPDGTIIYDKEASEGIFYFFASKKGEYTFTLKNTKWTGKKLTTVAIGLGENPSLRSDHIKDFTNYIQDIVSETKKLKNEIKYLASKHSAHIERMRKITNKTFLYCFIKLFVLIVLSFFTIYYIKNLVQNKRVL